MQPADTGNLDTILFLLGLAVTFGLEAMKAETLPRRTGFWVLTALCFFSAVGWTYVKPLWPAVTGPMALISINPVAWFIVGMFFLAVFAFHRPKQKPAAPNARLAAPNEPTLAPTIIEATPLSVAAVEIPEIKEFVDVDPNYLLGLRQQPNMSRIQTSRLVAPYLGKWIKTTGKVCDVTERYVSLYCDNDDDKLLRNVVVLQPTEDQKEHFHLLRLGQTISGIGKLERVDVRDVVLDQCELLE